MIKCSFRILIPSQLEKAKEKSEIQASIARYVMIKTDCDPPKIITVIMQDPPKVGNLQSTIV